MAHDLMGESPITTRQGEGLAKDNGAVALWRDKTGNAYEARMLDKAARHVEVQTLNGRHSL